MTRKIKAIFSNGKLTPIEPIDLKEGEEVTASIDDKPKPAYCELFSTV